MPVFAPDAPGRSKSIGPFVDPDPDFAVAYPGPLHTLELSMYCVYRPAFVLHTNVFKTQTEALDSDDIAASWAVLNGMKTPSLILYNWEIEAGSSQVRMFLPVGV